MYAIIVSVCFGGNPDPDVRIFWVIKITNLEDSANLACVSIL